MKNKISAAVATATILLVGLGCSKLALPGKVNLLEGDNAVKAVAKLKDKISADQVNVIRVEIRKDEMELTIQSPKNPKDIDKYTFKNGVVSGPEPVQIMSIGSLEMTADKYDTTNIDEIGFTAIPETIKQAIALSELENAGVTLISMDGQSPQTGNPQLKEDRKKELDALDKEFKEKRDACFNLKGRQMAACLFEIKPLYDKAQDLRSGRGPGKTKLVLTWRLFVESPRGRKDFWADKDGKLNEKWF
jgi:hypothetical protein